MEIHFNKLKLLTGAPIPEDLKTFLEGTFSIAPPPIGLKFNNVEFILEIQYFLDVTCKENYNPKLGYLKFAVTTDGNELIVNLKNDYLSILQSEDGDIDSLGLILKDILNANTYSL
ncbi:hypothetical protein [Acanthopleuribacter pedis]|uniref:Uncharacterized protein n=1 Tax=Acanthopleuribacter pedis TaxID=442870 RepID=A0A8J7U6R3_9BACT|nr:hypothetical protein [Acanthopleuribacter pedis]MBO1321703.1 hypothetical protein [Acanthopleuribacter pedis]